MKKREVIKNIISEFPKGKNLYKTSKGTDYKFFKISRDGGITYTINGNQKTLPLETIVAAVNSGRTIDRKWYMHYNEPECKSRPCNLSVLRNLIAINSYLFKN